MKLFLLVFFSSIQLINIQLSKENSRFIKKNIHSAWDIQLKKFVSNEGKVNYKDWKNEMAGLESYINNLKRFIPNQKWNKNEILSYWINAYNALTVNLILKNYPIKSIKNIEKPWDKKIFKLNNISYSLNDIEHKILRKMDEPRIHFAINCASLSCPKLLNQAFTSNRLENQLKSVTDDFINNQEKNKITSEVAKISKIFKWFSSDFGSRKELIEFINMHSKLIINNSTKIYFLSYDWSLNE